MTRSFPVGGVARHNIFACPVGPQIYLEAPDMAGLTQRFDSHSGEVKALLTSAAGKIDEQGRRLDEKSGELDGRLSEIEQRIARRNAGGVQETKSLGSALVESEEFKSLAGSASQRGSARVEFETKTMLSASGTWGTGVSSSSSLVVADRQPMIELPKRPLILRDLLTIGNTVSNAVEYPQQTGFTNNAAVVAENTTKPYSNLTTDLKSAPVRTIAHLMKASRQILDDAPMLQSFINSQMIYGLRVVEEAEILNGDGTGQHLLGLIPQATAYTAPFTITSETAIDRLSLAMGQAEVALVPSTGILLHPLDWRKIQLVKDGMGRYLVGDPQSLVAKSLWDTPIATSLAITQGTFLVGAFKDAATLFERMSVEVLLSTENVDDFEKNMVSIRVEERVALAVFRPQGFIVGTLP